MSDTIESVQTKLEELRKFDAPKPASRIGDGFDLTPVVYQWSCHYCKRGFESTGVKGFKMPPVMVCAECSVSYDNKIEKNLQLTQEQTNAAVKMGSVPLELKGHFDETMARWEQLCNTTNPYERVKWLKMIALARRTMNGESPKAAQQQTKTKEGWRR